MLLHLSSQSVADTKRLTLPFLPLTLLSAASCRQCLSTNVLCSELKGIHSVCVCSGRGVQHVGCPLLAAGLSPLRDGRLLMGLNSCTATPWRRRSARESLWLARWQGTWSAELFPGLSHCRQSDWQNRASRVSPCLSQRTEMHRMKAKFKATTAKTPLLSWWAWTATLAATSGLKLLRHTC